MSERDQRLAAVLLMLGDGMPVVVDQVLAGALPVEDRQRLAAQLRRVADDLDVVVTSTSVTELQAGNDDRSHP